MSATERQPCGIGGCEPACMGRFASINWFTGFYSVSGLLTSSLTVFIGSQITTIERQFGLSSTSSGYLMTFNDIGFSLFVLIGGYLAKRVHVPRFLASSAILYGISGITCAIPHFIFSADSVLTVPGSPNQTQSIFQSSSLLCNGPVSSAGEGASPFNNATTGASVGGISNPLPSANLVRNVSFALIAIGMFVQGIAKSIRSPMLTQYVDDNTRKEETGMYMGIIAALSIFGPAIAFGLGGYVSQIHVTLEDVDIHPHDPRWVGAWWLGFLAFGVLAIIFATPLLFFPRSLAATASLDDGEKAEEEQTRRHNLRCGCKCIGREVKGIVKDVIHVFQSKIYNICLLAMLVNTLGMAATMTFIPKYIELSFNVPAWKANIVIATVGILSASIGSFLGGWLTKKVNLNPPRCIMLIIGTSVLSIITGFVLFSFYCDQPVYNNSPPGLGSRYVTNSSCSDLCDCTNAPYLPICGSDNNNHFSPCHAGCQTGAFFSFENCTCIPGGSATTGLCDFDCNMLIPFSVIAFVSGIVSSTTMMPGYILLLRSVPNEVKSMGIGIFSLAVSLLAFVPGPVIGGKLVDVTCLLWSQKGSCSLYDVTRLRYNLYGMGVACNSLSVVIYAIALFFSWNMSKWPSEVAPRRWTEGQKPESDILMDKYKHKE